jgi:ankyrin repeat protein
MYQRISISTTSGLIEAKQPLIFDVRDAASYEAAHLPGAVFLSDRALKSTIKQAARSRAILVYCYHGNASRDIAKLFCDFGFTEVYSMDGGFESWRKAMAADEEAKLPLSPGLEMWLLEQHFDPANLEARVHAATALIRACQLGRADIVAELLDAGAKLDAVDGHGNDALWAACYSADLPTLALLVKAGIALNRQNPLGSSSLMYAASAGRTQAVEYLLRAGADTKLENQDGFTALDLAANLEILKLLKPYRQTL